MKRPIIKSIFFLTILPVLSQAHPEIDFPEGGETFSAGESIVIQWHIAIDHEQEDWDIYFTPDGGESWDTIVSNLAVDKLEYNWIIPDINTTKAQIRVVMDNVEGVADYEDICQPFTIEGSSIISGIEDAYGESIGKNLIRVYPNPSGGKVKFSLDFGGKNNLKLQIYDAMGNQVFEINNHDSFPEHTDISWNGSEYSSGTYFYCLLYKDIRETGRIVIEH